MGELIVRAFLIIWVAAVTLVLASALGAGQFSQQSYSPAPTALCVAQQVQSTVPCITSAFGMDMDAKQHQAPTSHPVQLPQRAMGSHPSYFLHPEQQPLYLLAYTLAQQDEPSRLDKIRLTPRTDLPWYMHTCLPNSGLLDNCKAANLTYRSRLLYDSLPG
ncbi:hypothetical protein [Pseudoalteromonas sp. T1lg75]|uniref:hypothetical protein n=1 Tax=Pseudoalteromonas sp. T1lg75 TaxID=2077102 RepID=UPI000CF7394E|nr:hypothetical protein [Pseudoalteromonas sp. T1lg75]